MESRVVEAFSWAVTFFWICEVSILTWVLPDLYSEKSRVTG